MQRVSATEAARRFSRLLDEVERHGESFTVTRRGRPVARIGPAAATTGATLLKIAKRHPPDAAWAGELLALREILQLGDRSSSR